MNMVKQLSNFKKASIHVMNMLTISYSFSQRSAECLTQYGSMLEACQIINGSFFGCSHPSGHRAGAHANLVLQYSVEKQLGNEDASGCYSATFSSYIRH